MTMSNGPCRSATLRQEGGVLLVTDLDDVASRAGTRRFVDVDTDDLRRGTEVVAEHRQASATVDADLEHPCRGSTIRREMSVVDREVVDPFVQRASALVGRVVGEQRVARQRLPGLTRVERRSVGLVDRWTGRAERPKGVPEPPGLVGAIIARGQGRPQDRAFRLVDLVGHRDDIDRAVRESGRERVQHDRDRITAQQVRPSLMTPGVMPAGESDTGPIQAPGIRVRPGSCSPVARTRTSNSRSA